ncbi:hypothetical protein [Acidianus two-tailed virus 2]|nr:hypothetical protein [Acidianus two-tailed virus 2]
MEQTHPNLEKLEKLEYFLVDKLEEKIKEALLVRIEDVSIVMMQRPTYNYFNKRYYTRGVLKIGNKQYIMLIEVSKRYIFVKSKPVRLTLSWKDIDNEVEE